MRSFLFYGSVRAHEQMFVDMPSKKRSRSCVTLSSIRHLRPDPIGVRIDVRVDSGEEGRPTTLTPAGYADLVNNLEDELKPRVKILSLTHFK